jgi:hypothetical protein
LAFSATIMFSQKTTSVASTVSPSDHFQPFMVIVTVLSPLEYTGAAAGDSA